MDQIMKRLINELILLFVIINTLELLQLQAMVVIMPEMHCRQVGLVYRGGNLKKEIFLYIQEIAKIRRGMLQFMNLIALHIIKILTIVVK